MPSFELFFSMRQFVSAVPSSAFDDDLADLSLVDETTNVDISDEIEKNIKKFQCVNKSVEDAIKGTKYVYVKSKWEVTQKDLEIFFNRVNACKHIGDETEKLE